ncbi:MAG: hypothetical protein K2L28_08480 [Muribaculaceae bacterium]|nr:hypothetical protein [Muribaculaceae bacterium]
MRSLLFTACLFTSLFARSASILIEGEAFQFKGKWVVEKSSECLGTAMLRVYQDSRAGAADDALTVVNISRGAPTACGLVHRTLRRVRARAATL